MSKAELDWKRGEQIVKGDREEIKKKDRDVSEEH